MAFSYSNPDYVFKARWTETQAALGESIFTTAIDNKWSSTQLIETLKEEGLSYRRQDVLADWSRAQATEWSSSPEKYDKANRFWDTMEQMRQDTGIIDRAEASRKLSAWINGSFETLEEVEEYGILEPAIYPTS
jgi:hypothetical protein